MKYTGTIKIEELISDAALNFTEKQSHDCPHDEVEICPDSPEGQPHQPDLGSVSRCQDAGPGVLDISCRRCGASGSFTLDPEDVLW